MQEQKVGNQGASWRGAWLNKIAKLREGKADEKKKLGDRERGKTTRRTVKDEKVKTKRGVDG